MLRWGLAGPGSVVVEARSVRLHGNDGPMRTVLSYPGNMAHAQQAALALHEVGALDKFVTTFVWRRNGPASRLLSLLPSGLSDRVCRQLERRSVSLVPDSHVCTYPGWELLRTAASKLFSSPVPADWVWDRMSHSFDATVARHHVEAGGAVMAFEYTALASFREAERRGAARILQLPALHGLAFEAVVERERQLHPELATSHDSYFDKRFEERSARRRQEVELADVIVTNSVLTARSHILFGADPSKVIVVPLGCPPALEERELQFNSPKEPLSIMWAGPFSLRKGAHYLLDAWKKLAPGADAKLDVYGQVLISDAVDRAHAGIRFHGSVSRQLLFSAYKRADVLVFPTLSDGFGMVVGEAMAHGLPVITTDQAGAADLVTEDNGLIVPAGDAAALCESLRWCLGHRGRLSEMRIEALRTAQRHQWSDFRIDLRAKLESALTRAGYSPVWDLTTRVASAA